MFKPGVSLCKAYGAEIRYDLRNDKSKSELTPKHQLFIFLFLERLLRVSHMPLRLLCLLLAIGDSCRVESHFTERFTNIRVHTLLEEALLKDFGGFYCELVVQSGYKPEKLDGIVEEHPGLAQKLQEFRETYNKPLTLKRQAANVIRTSLKPNAVAGLKHLNLPPGFDSSYITLENHTHRRWKNQTLYHCKFTPYL